MNDPSTSEICTHSEGTEYIIHARTEPGSEYTEVIPALAILRVQCAMDAMEDLAKNICKLC